MKHLAADLTLDKDWQAEQERRLLGFEVLKAFLLADGRFELNPVQIAERTLCTKLLCFQILRKIASNEAIKSHLNADPE